MTDRDTADCYVCGRPIERDHTVETRRVRGSTRTVLLHEECTADGVRQAVERFNREDRMRPGRLAEMREDGVQSNLASDFL